jgi:hypothetical protein
MAAVVDLTQAQLFAGVEQFLLNFSTPALTDDGLHVIPGNANDQSLPADGGDFCIYTPLFMGRRGTNVEEWQKAPVDAVNYSEYVETVWQIDCFSQSMVYAQQMAQTFELIARSEAGVNFFKPLYIDCLFAENVRNLSLIVDAKKYVARWSLELHLGFRKQVQVQFDYFTSATVNVVNVDVKFPPV